MFDLITSWLPQNSPSIPIPGKIFRFLEEFCFSPETHLLTVDTSVTATTHFVLPCALKIIVLVVSGTTISQGWKLALAHSSVNTTWLSTNLSLLVAFTNVTCPMASAVKMKDVRAKNLLTLIFFWNFHQFEIMGYSCQKCKKIEGSLNSFRRYDVQKITQNLRDRASLLHTDKVPVCAKSLQINPFIEILSANYCSCGSINKIRWTKKLPQSWFYHLADTFLLS